MAAHHHDHDVEQRAREETIAGLTAFGVGFVFLVIVAGIAWWLAHTFH